MSGGKEADRSPPAAAPGSERPNAGATSRGTLRRLLRRVPWNIVGPAFSIALFAGALFVLARLLQEVKADDVVLAFTATPGSAIALSVLFTVCSYLALTGYDGLALRQIGAVGIPYSTAAIGSFTSYAISYTLGLPLITAGTVRYRVYGGAGLTAPQIAALTLVCTLTFWLGMGGVLAVGLVVVPDAVARVDQLPAVANMALGVLILAAIAGYIAYVSTRRRVVTVEGWSLPLPGGRVTATQIVLGVLDVCAGSGALYVLLPGDVGTPFLTFTVIYVLAAFLGVASHAPGGIGVFEATMLIALPSVPRDQLLGSILLYRVIYYFAPFALALATLGIYEIARRRHVVDRLVDQASGVMKLIAPTLVAGAVFLVGATLIVTGALPLAASRREILSAAVPLPLVEAAHLAAALVGIALLFFARGLIRRLAGAWLAASLLLGLAIGLELLRGADVRLAAATFGILLVVLLAHPAFPRTARMFNRDVSPIWLSLVTAVLVIAGWTGTFTYRAVDYHPGLWTTFAYEADMPRFLRAMATAVLGALLLGLFAFGRRERTGVVLARGAEVNAILDRAEAAQMRLALLPEGAMLAGERGDTGLVVAARGTCSIALGDPVGPSDRARDVLWAFRERAERLRLWPVLVGATHTLGGLYLEAGMTLTHIGDALHIDLADARTEPFADTEAVLAWGDAEGLSLDLLRPGTAGPLMDSLSAVSRAWLAAPGRREGHFVLGRFDPRWIAANDCAVLRRAGEIVGFAVVLRGARDIEWTVDIVRFQPDLGLAALDFILLRLIRLARARGVRRFDLGLTPSPDMDVDALGPTWRRVTPLLFRLGDHLPDFSALRAFKQRFAPVAEPRYLACTAGFALPHILLEVTALIEHGPSPAPGERAPPSSALPAPASA